LIAILCRELLYIQEKNEQFVENGMVHFAKFRKIHQTINKFVRFTSTPYPFERVDKISHYIEEKIRNAPTESTLDQCSRELIEL